MARTNEIIQIGTLKPSPARSSIRKLKAFTLQFHYERWSFICEHFHYKYDALSQTHYSRNGETVEIPAEVEKLNDDNAGTWNLQFVISEYFVKVVKAPLAHISCFIVRK
jgi:hypothetical protein